MSSLIPPRVLQVQGIQLEMDMLLPLEGLGCGLKTCCFYVLLAFVSFVPRIFWGCLTSLGRKAGDGMCSN